MFVLHERKDRVTFGNAFLFFQCKQNTLKLFNVFGIQLQQIIILACNGIAADNIPAFFYECKKLIYLGILVHNEHDKSLHGFVDLSGVDLHGEFLDDTTFAQSGNAFVDRRD